MISLINIIYNTANNWSTCNVHNLIGVEGKLSQT
jgi:hypothetical protein